VHMLGLKPVALIAFSMTNLSQSEKMALTYRLYGKRKKASGTLSVYRGQKVGLGCILVPAEHAPRILEVLREYKVRWEAAQLYARI